MMSRAQTFTLLIYLTLLVLAASVSSQAAPQPSADLLRGDARPPVAIRAAEGVSSLPTVPTIVLSPSHRTRVANDARARLAAARTPDPTLIHREATTVQGLASVETFFALLPPCSSGLSLSL
jgi:hypothetical protein